MGKPELGTKRTCHACAARFYDLHRSPIVCPKCGIAHDPQAVLKTRRSRNTVAPEKPVVKAAKPAPVAAELEEAIVEDDLEKIETPGDDDEQDVIEDPAELGDDSDVAEVIEKVDEEEP